MSQRGYIFRKGGAWYLRYRDDILGPDGTPKRRARNPRWSSSSLSGAATFHMPSR